MAVIALLVVGAIYFFVINDGDSEIDTDANANTQNSNQEEANTDTGTGTEDDGSIVLTEIGFDCQTTTIAAEAAARVVQAQAIAEEDPGAVVLAQLYVDLVGESEAANNEVLKCSHAENQLGVLVASNANANLLSMTTVQVACAALASDNLSPETQELYLQGLRSDFEADPPLVIGSETYLADGPAEAQQQLRALFQAEGIEYTPAPTPEFACAT